MYRRVASCLSTGLASGLVGTDYRTIPQGARSGAGTADESERHVTTRALSIAVLASHARSVRAPTETTCSVSDVTLCTHLHRKSETVSHKPTGMTRDCRSLPSTHPRSTHPDRHTPLHPKNLDFRWFTATRTRLSSRSPLVRTACEGTRDLCTAGEGTVRVEACRFRPSSFPVSQCPETAPRLRPVKSSSNSSPFAPDCLRYFPQERAPKLTFGLFVYGSSPPPPLYPQHSRRGRISGKICAASEGLYKLSKVLHGLRNDLRQNLRASAL